MFKIVCCRFVVCGLGFISSFYIVDIDECIEDASLCTGDKQSCKNTDGSYTCACEGDNIYDPESQLCIPKPKGT